MQTPGWPAPSLLAFLPLSDLATSQLAERSNQIAVTAERHLWKNKPVRNVEDVIWPLAFPQGKAET